MRQIEEKAGSLAGQKRPFSGEVEGTKIGRLQGPPAVAMGPSTLTLVLLLLFSSPFPQSLLGPPFPLVEKETKQQLEKRQERQEKEMEMEMEKQGMGLWVWRWVWEEEGELKERAEEKRSWKTLVQQEEEGEEQELELELEQEPQ